MPEIIFYRHKESLLK